MKKTRFAAGPVSYTHLFVLMSDSEWAAYQKANA